MTAATIILRLARPADASAIALMSRDLIEAGLGWSYRPARIARLILDRDTNVLIAARRGNPVGFAVMSFGDERAHLALLAVHPAHQRQGVARRLLEWLVECAASAGIASLHLELRAGNAAARAFYRDMGFAERYVVPGYYHGRESALRMQRVLRLDEPASVRWQPPNLGADRAADRRSRATRR
ncbi:MAG: GNAT family N-acetyltransferase [Burkholderiaceae bacterium]